MSLGRDDRGLEVPFVLEVQVVLLGVGYILILDPGHRLGSVYKCSLNWIHGVCISRFFHILQ